MIAGIPLGIQQAVSGAIIAGCFLLLGKGADWLIKRRGERRTLTLEEHGIEDDRLGSIADRFKELAVAERTRADQIAMERDTMERTLTAKINALSLDIVNMKAAIAEKDALISEMAAEIRDLKRRVTRIEPHERQHKSVEGKD